MKLAATSGCRNWPREQIRRNFCFQRRRNQSNAFGFRSKMTATTKNSSHSFWWLVCLPNIERASKALVTLSLRAPKTRHRYRSAPKSGNALGGAGGSQNITHCQLSETLNPLSLRDLSWGRSLATTTIIIIILLLLLFISQL